MRFTQVPRVFTPLRSPFSGWRNIMMNARPAHPNRGHHSTPRPSKTAADVSHLGLGIAASGAPARAAQVTRLPLAASGPDEVAPPTSSAGSRGTSIAGPSAGPGVRNVDPDAFRHIHVPMFGHLARGQSDHCLTSHARIRIPADSACTGVGRTLLGGRRFAVSRPTRSRAAQPDDLRTTFAPRAISVHRRPRLPRL